MAYGDFMLMPSGDCILCRRKQIPILVPTPPSLDVGLCEPCARLADWRFRDMRDSELAGVPFPTAPGAALALIVRDRVVDGHPDTLCPRDVLMVERKDEPGKWGLSGGKVEPGESPVVAAVRELAEETTVLAWTAGCDLLYSGFSARGRLVDAYLCRAYGGAPADVEGEGKTEWKPWPPSAHVGIMRGYYRGLEIAFDARLALYKALGNEPPLCQHLGKSALIYVSEGFAGLAGDAKHMEAMSYVMTDEEKLAANIVLREVREPKPPEAPEAEVEVETKEKSESSNDDVDFGDDAREGPK